MDFKINVQDVNETGNSLRTRNSSFKESVENIYSTINMAKSNAWQSTEADMYYDSIVNYRAKLEEISSAIEYWQNKAYQIAENFDTASTNIRNSINNI